MKLLLRLIINTLAVLVAAYVVPGVKVDGYFVALVVAVVLGLLNTFIKPILSILTLPITILTLGLFSLVINVILVMTTDYIVEGFAVSGFIAAFLFSIVVSLVNWLLNELAD